MKEIIFLPCIFKGKYLKNSNKYIPFKSFYKPVTIRDVLLPASDIDDRRAPYICLRI